MEVKPLDTAKAYLNFGFSVLPLRPREKRPLGEWAPYMLKAASLQDAEAWRAQNPDGNIAIVTGQVSGVFVLDIDTPEGEEEASRLGLPETPTVATAHGHHYYFKHPGGQVRNFARKMPGMDLRGDGGYVVAPPSIHPDGGRYEWIVHPKDVPFADAPQWLMDVIQNGNEPKAQQAPPMDFTYTGTIHPYVSRAIEDETDAVKSAIEGNRNDQLFKSAASLGELVAGGVLPESKAYGSLYDAACSCGLDADRECGPHGIEKTIHSGFNRGAQSPRGIPAGAIEFKVPPRAVDLSREPDGPPPGVAMDMADEVPPWRAFERDFNRTDMGNAQRLVHHHGSDLRYCHAWGTWLIWDGCRWRRDENEEIMRRAKDTVRRIYGEAEGIADEKYRKDIAKHAVSSESTSRLKAMVELAKSEPGIPVGVKELDDNPWLLNVANGTLNLKTGKLQPHRREDLLTKILPVEYDPDAECPLWYSFLDTVMDGDDELVAFLQRAVGYALTGITSEHCLFFLYGTGRNGKSTFAEVVLALMGEYAQKAPSSMLMASRGSSIPNDVARLPGARFVIASEVNQGRSWDEALVKDLTGGDRMVARFLHQEHFEFTSTHKLWIYGNHKPNVHGTDDGIWSRIHLVPFTVFIKPEKRDPHLIEKLCQELPGILAWAVMGCMTWQASGLMLPKAVRDATAQYRSEMDVLGDFLDDQCIVEMDNVNLKTTVKTMYIEYTEWCKRLNQRPEKKQSFNELMRRRGFEDRRGTGNALTWYGVQIKGQASQGEMVL